MILKHSSDFLFFLQYNTIINNVFIKFEYFSRSQPVLSGCVYDGKSVKLFAILINSCKNSAHFKNRNDN